LSAGAHIGLLGGSFDPPHLAHLALARVARDTLNLTELRWLVAGAPWQKAGRRMAPAQHRLAMVQALLVGEPAMVADDRELRRAGPTYTLDTARELAREFPGAKLTFILGQDQWARLSTWHGLDELGPLLHWAVAARAGHEVHTPPQLAPLNLRFCTLPLPRTDISATFIRQRCAQGLEVASLAGSRVAGYISHHNLYTPLDGHP
jgi:nicotinate-nucleotide adenylyltransferase